MKILLLCFFCTIVHIPSIIMRYQPFREIADKKQKHTLLLIYSVTLLLNAGLYYAVYQMGRLSIQFYKYNLVLFCVGLAIANALVLRRRAREHFFAFGLTANVIYLLLSVVSFIEDKLPIHDIGWQLAINAALLCALFAAMYKLLVGLMCTTLKPFMNINSLEYRNNIWFVPTAMFFATFLSFPMKEHITEPVQLISRMLIGIATLFICRSVSYEYAQLKKREELNNSLNQQREYYTALSEKVEDARRARHDFKHHTDALKSYVSNDDYAGLTKYVNELTNTDAAEPFIPFTGNSAADGIIYHYVLLCEKENIRFDSEGMLKDSTIADIDLCVLLGNALDNAFTACLTADGERFISLSFRQNRGLLTVTVQNSFDGVVQKKNDTILSRKRKNAAGVGLSSMHGICEKYNGDMRIGYEKNTFSLMLLIETE